MRAALVSLLLLLASGCPPDPDEPMRPDNARTCSSDGDCKPQDGGLACGEIYACVDQRCETTPSRFVPCE